MKYIITIIFTISTLLSSAQNEQAKTLFDKGIKSYELKDYKTADSLFKQSMILQSDKETSYYLALVRKELNDNKGYCKILKTSYKLGKKEALDTFCNQCITADSANLDKEVLYILAFKHLEKNDICSYCKCLKLAADKGLNDAITYFNINCTLSNTTEKRCPYYNDSTYVIKTSEKTLTDEIVLKTCEKMPEFPGGIEAMMRYIQANIRYPQEARWNNIQGKVFISFVINKNGEVKNPKIIRGIGGGTEDEAIRLVENMPRWIPGKVNEEPVNVEFVLPLIFKLSSN